MVKSENGKEQLLELFSNKELNNITFSMNTNMFSSQTNYICTEKIPIKLGRKVLQYK